MNNLLDLDRMAIGKPGLTLALIAVNTLIEETLASFRHVVPARRSGTSFRHVVPHALQPFLDPSTPLVIGDPDRLVQALTNLVANAVKYSPDGGTITVTSVADADVVEIAVADTGPGVPPEFREAIFN